MTMGTPRWGHTGHQAQSCSSAKLRAGALSLPSPRGLGEPSPPRTLPVTLVPSLRRLRSLPRHQPPPPLLAAR